MPREITTHKVNGCNEALTITALDGPGPGGASHLYQIEGFNSGTNPSAPWTDRHGLPAQHSTILFQNGPILEVGTNGVTHEALLATLIDRLDAFQEGPFACRENDAALTFLESALMWLKKRTMARAARGVEGTNEK